MKKSNQIGVFGRFTHNRHTIERGVERNGNVFFVAVWQLGRLVKYKPFSEKEAAIGFYDECCSNLREGVLVL